MIFISLIPLSGQLWLVHCVCDKQQSFYLTQIVTAFSFYQLIRDKRKRKWNISSFSIRLSWNFSDETSVLNAGHFRSFFFISRVHVTALTRSPSFLSPEIIEHVWDLAASCAHVSSRLSASHTHDYITIPITRISNSHTPLQLKTELLFPHSLSHTHGCTERNAGFCFYWDRFLCLSPSRRFTAQIPLRELIIWKTTRCTTLREGGGGDADALGLMS